MRAAMIGATSPRSRTVNAPPPLESASTTRSLTSFPSASATASAGSLTGGRSRRGAHGLIAACGKGREINVIVGVAGDPRQCVDRRLLDVVVFVAGKRAQ